MSRVISLFGDKIDDVLQKIEDDEATELFVMYRCKDGMIKSHWTEFSDFFQFIGRLRVFENDMIQSNKVCTECTED